ncbi:Mrp/NBP35 family ATP-binding protein [Reichenbachiella agarivorans]|uniref:Iron-sulfur cluster carrier protein n=1 Tax=Reichenbachiella agarivorans TaxID=2979464 RepID=A0ABY6CLQ9_9BACT|nr:Mrp/NBP35 family ATP-binding protein [Reichenbachiella agarivorans]UXP31442.1 Mrp/NBP35 family ATP-binding protein [Reichenbachiella agarivorans]
MKVTNKEVLQALSTVQDPDLKQDLVTLKMIKNLVVTDEKISFTVELTTPACPLKEKIKKDCMEAVEKVANGLKIELDMSAQVTSTRGQSFTLPKVKNIIAVSSGKGGVGKSTVTANLAVALAKSGAEVGIIDADIFGPSIPTMFNCEHEQPDMVMEDGKNLIIPIMQYGVKLVSIGFLTPKDNAIVWRGPMASSALKQFISDVKWGELDYLLIDLPPGTSDIHLTLVQSVPVTGAIIVTSPQKVAIADARKGLAMFKLPQINVPILGVIENMAYFTPAELPDSKYYIFGQDGGRKLAEKEEVPFLGEIPIVQSIRESGDSGYPAVMKEGITEDAFTELAQSVARQVAIRNANGEKTKVVQMS